MPVLNSTSPSAPQPQVVAQFRSLIWHSLDNGLLDSALFTAERLHAYDPKSSDSVHLLGVCLVRDAQYQQAENLMKGWLRHVGCAYVYAQACLKLAGGRESSGINALEACKRHWNMSAVWNAHTDTERKALPDAAAIYCMLGKLWQSLGDSKKAVDSYVAAVKVNPFLWEAFTGLCDTGVNLRVNNIFKQSAEMMEALKTTVGGDDTAVAARVRISTENQQHDPFTATSQNRDRSDLQYSNHPSFLNRLNEGVAGSAVPAQLETPTAQSSNSSTQNDMMGATNGAVDKPPALRKTRATADVGSRKLTSRSTRDHNTESKRPNMSTSEPTVPAAPARRSTRLNTLKFASKLGGSDRDAKISTKDRDRERDREAKKRAVSTRTRSIHHTGGNTAALAKDGKDRGSSEDVNVRGLSSPFPLSQPQDFAHVNDENSNPSRMRKRKASESLLTEVIKKQMSDVNPKQPAMVAPVKTIVDQKKEEAQVYLLEMYKLFGMGYFNLAHFRCQESLLSYKSLPTEQINTPWTLCQIGKAHHEMANYAEAEKVFRNVRELDPVRTKDMEVFSTILWHQRKDVDLSYLAHELIDHNRDASESWCALGNCFSLQRDHDQALRCFKRATQIDPRHPYAFTLQGHEHVSNEEYEKALVSYRSAITADARHYNAWYGLGKVYEKMGKYEIAEKHFRTAAKINPTNPVLICCVGMVLEKTRDYVGALAQYNSACKIAPKSALSRFKKARTLLSLQKYRDALEELTILKDLAPDEANVHFLLGRLYKSLHDKTNAIKHLTIALNLDPKASHLIKEVIENLDDDDDAYLAEDSEVYRFLDGNP